MPSTLADGWLAFQAGTVRRRLAPIPTHWESCTDRELAQLCRAAEPAPPAQTAIRRADDGTSRDT
jgi:hypothetical protein